MKPYKYLKGGKLKRGEAANGILEFIYQNDQFDKLPDKYFLIKSEQDELTDSQLRIKTSMISMYAAQCESILECLQKLLEFSTNKEEAYKHGVIHFVSKDRQSYTSTHIRYWNILYIILFDEEGIPRENIDNIIEQTTKEIKKSNFNYLPEPILLNEKFIINIIIPYLKKYKNSEETFDIDSDKDKRDDKFFIDECNEYFINNFDFIKKYAEFWIDAKSPLSPLIKEKSGQYIIDSYINNLSSNTLKKSLNIDRLILKNLIEQVQHGGGLLDYFTSQKSYNKSPSIIQETIGSARSILQNIDEDKKQFIMNMQDSIDEKRSLTHIEKEKLEKLIKNMEDKLITTRIGGKLRKTKKKKTKKTKKNKKIKKLKKTKKW